MNTGLIDQIAAQIVREVREAPEAKSLGKSWMLIQIRMEAHRVREQVRDRAIELLEMGK